MSGVGKSVVPAVLFCALAALVQAQERPASPPACPPPEGATVVAAGRPAEPAPVTTAAGAVSKAAAIPLTARQKFDVFTRSTYSPYTFVSTVFNAAMAQANDDWYSYGGGMKGYGKRFGASLANTESGVLFGTFLYPTIFRQDPRYLSEYRGPALHRVAFAASRVLITKNDAGSQTFNSSHVLAAFTASTLANAYYPREDRSVGDTMVRAGGSLMNDAITNVLREFWPDIRRKLLRHEPERIKRIEESPRVTRLEQMIIPPQPAACPLAEPGNSRPTESTPPSNGQNQH